MHHPYTFAQTAAPSTLTSPEPLLESSCPSSPSPSAGITYSNPESAEAIPSTATTGIFSFTSPPPQSVETPASSITTTFSAAVTATFTPHHQISDLDTADAPRSLFASGHRHRRSASEVALSSLPFANHATASIWADHVTRQTIPKFMDNNNSATNNGSALVLRHNNLHSQSLLSQTSNAQKYFASGSAAVLSKNIHRSGSLLDMSFYAAHQPELPHNHMRQLNHHESSSGDEAGTLFNFDEDTDITSSNPGRISNQNLRSSSLDGSVESASDAYTWVGSFDQNGITTAVKNSFWRTPGHAIDSALASGKASLLSPPVAGNYLSEYSTSEVSPAFSGGGGTGAAIVMPAGVGSVGRRGVNASPNNSQHIFHPRNSAGDVMMTTARFGSIGVNSRNIQNNAEVSGFNLPPALENANLIKAPTSPRIFPKEHSPLFLPNSSDSAKNIWGAPNISIGVSLLKSTTPSTESLKNYDPSRLVPSELLNSSNIHNNNVMPQQFFTLATTTPTTKIATATTIATENTASFNKKPQLKTKLNPLSAPFEFYPSTNFFGNEQQPSPERSNQNESYHEQQQQLFAKDSLSPITVSTAAVPFVSPFAMQILDTSLSFSSYQQKQNSAFYDYRNITSAKKGMDVNGMFYNHGSSLGNGGYSNSTSSGGGSGVGGLIATDLRIVKEIQTSKLKVDESKLTNEYFEQLTREAGVISFHICPTIDERGRQEVTFGNVFEVARRAFPDSNLHHFGSTALGFSLANADMDLSISLNDNYMQFTSAQLVEKLGAVMKSAGMRDVKLLTRARVPIVKIRDPVTGIRCDIGFQSNLVLYNTRLLKAYSQIDSRFRELVFIIKYWSKQRNINEPYFGTLSSYCFVLMIIHFLQIRGVLPCLQKIVGASRNTDGSDIPYVNVDGFNVYFFEQVHDLVEYWHCDNSESVGELVVAFFKYYSAEFPYKNTGVASVRTGGVVPKEEKGWTKEKQQEINRYGAVKDRYWLCVEDPFEITNNVGRPVDKETLFEVRGEFIRASKILCAGSISPDESVLSRVCEKAPVVISKKGAGGNGNGGGGNGGGMVRKW
ncbi:hypothetical protein HK100_012897 [Physocladia obscura]|uniref:polynucleotide adenylyltransferase n=1 Tax=Physocladia obscura TaxID=109957 RepID=A0AAD5T0U3_9FUNG|nr:hypothetical protein HK100_012897 [Physocladia obscura]